MRVIVLAPLLVVLLSHSARPQQAMQTAPTYRSLVDGYRSSGTTEIEQTLKAPRDATEAAVDAALSPASGWTWEELRGAAMLHSEVALRALRSNDERATDVHLSLARRLLDCTVRLSRPQKDFAWRWDMVIPHAVERLGGRDIALRLDADAHERWAHDTARQAFLRGLILERHGARLPRAEVLGESRSSAPAKLHGAWSEAATLFANALREDPSLRAAALHLGRLRMLQGQRVEAATLFRSALVDTSPAVAYLAALFLGSLEERDGRFDVAERLYRTAVARIPLGQSAPLALAELLSRTGREPEARDVLAAHVLRPGAALVEPMWAFGPPLESPGTQIDLLRLEVWK